MVDAIQASARARIAAEARDAGAKKKRKVLAGGPDTEVTGYAPWNDPNCDLSPREMEKAFYASMAKVDLAV